MKTIKEALKHGMQIRREVRFYAIEPRAAYMYSLQHDWTMEVVDQKLIEDAIKKTDTPQASDVTAKADTSPNQAQIASMKEHAASPQAGAGGISLDDLKTLIVPQTCGCENNSCDIEDGAYKAIDLLFDLGYLKGVTND